MELADAEGLEAVTLRRVADLLGVTPMALYWHFRDKDQLLSALTERVLGAVDLPGEADEWTGQLRVLLWSVVRVLRGHRWATGLLAGRIEPSAPLLRVLDAVLAVLDRAGFTPDRAVSVTRHVLRTVIGLVTDEPGGAPARGLPEEVSARDYPHLVAAAEPLSVCDDPEDYYEFGLELVLAGVVAVSREP